MAQQQPFDAGVPQQALLQVAEATQSAAAAAKAASVVTASGLGQAASANRPVVDWSKLVSKPPVFDYANQEQDQRHYRDWLWQLSQYLLCVDEEFERELKQITEEPAKELDMDSAPADVRKRSAKLYGLLAGLVKNRALSIVRAAPPGNGFEALRQLTLSMRPNTQSRGLALLSSVTAWPSFAMQKPLQAQVLRLEDAYEETRRAGTVLGEDLKCAILLRCISGALKTHLSLNLKENCKYQELREEVLRWDRAHQKWSNLLQSTDDSTGTSTANDSVPMEIDRVEKGRGRGNKGKGKQNKGNAKGKSKSAGKDKGKGKNTGYENGRKSGKGKSGSNQGKKIGKGTDKACYVCGKTGHYARDCWNNQAVRNVQAGNQVQQEQVQSPAQPSPQAQQQSSSFSSLQSPQATQFRVSRISELISIAEDDQVACDSHEQFVFDLRDSPKSSQSPQNSIRAVHFFIGDDEDEFATQNGSIRAVVSEIPDDGELHSILLDSGADATVFPAAFLGAGSKVTGEVSKLHDAQGRVIPVQDMRDVEIHLVDQQGKVAVLRERVAISEHVHQPILCYGKMLECGWGIDSRQQTLVHDAGIQVPIELQNRSMVIKGYIRVISEDSTADEKPQVFSICAVKADVTYDLRIGPAGWTLDDQNCGVGRHHSNHFQDPTLVRPQMSGNLARTTLLRDYGEWYVLELCEPLDSLIDLSAEFYGYEGALDIITIITRGEKDPLVMGFKLLGDEQALFSSDKQDGPSDMMVSPDDQIEGVEIEVEQVQQGAQVPLEGRVVVQPSPTDMVLVNGVELTVDSSLRSLRAGLSFNGLSTSGSKQKCFERLLNFQKQLELQTVHAAATAAQQELLPRSVELQQPPSERDQQIHNLSHLPYANWCPACVAYRARSDRHERTGASQRSSVPSVSFDFCYTKCVPGGKDSKEIDSITALIMVDSASGYIQAVPLRNKNQWNLMVHELLSFTGLLGHSEVTYRCDNEPTLLQLQRMAINARLAMGLVTHKGSPPPYSKSNGLVENAIGRIRPLAGSLMYYMGEQVGVEFDTNSPWWSWALKHACWLVNRFGPSKVMSPYEIIHGKEFTGKTCCFGEPVFGLAKVEGKGTARWKRMIFITKSETHDSYLLYDGAGLVLTRSVRRISTNWKESFGLLHELFVLEF